MATPPSYQAHMRFSEADRDLAAARLRDAHADGRLTQSEFLSRLDLLYASSTYGDLQPVLAGLSPQPRPAAPVVGRPSQLARPDRGFPGWMRVLAVCLAIWVTTSLLAGHLLPFWPAWVAAGLGVAALVKRRGCGSASARSLPAP